MPRGASPKREREYKELKTKFKRSGRYKGREEEVASRIVNKQRARFGETKAAKSKSKSKKSSDAKKRSSSSRGRKGAGRSASRSRSRS